MGGAATKTKIRAMLRVGLLHGHDAIVLGAWGCGAFRNPPKNMARLFHEVLREPEFARKYHVVRFAVIEDRNSRYSNFAPFDRECNGNLQIISARELAERLNNPDFLETLTAEMLAGFKTTSRGCAHPRGGEING